MSRQVVGLVIDSLLTDDDLRSRFITNPMATLADIYARGLELTPGEIDLFLQTDRGTWFWTDQQAGIHVH